MIIKTAAAGAARVGRGCAAGIRALSPLAAIGLTLAVVAGGAGIAQAASGGDFILGQGNTEASRSTLTNAHGIPLELNGPANTPPLQVNRRTVVHNLNAQFVGGMSAPSLKITGSTGNTLGDVFSLALTPIATTAPLNAGTYYVTATTEVNAAAADTELMCILTKNKDTTHVFAQGGSNGSGEMQAAETVAIAVQQGDTLQQQCLLVGPDSTSQVDAGITAIKIAVSTGAQPATVGRPLQDVLPGLAH